MGLVSLRQLLDHAAENQYGIPAFNINNLEQVRAVMDAARDTSSPSILQISSGARRYAGTLFIQNLLKTAVKEYGEIPICIHQDHGTSPKICQQSIRLGFSSVMMDGSLNTDGKTPSSFDYNIRVTKQVVEMAHFCGVSVEGELGCLGSLETGEASEEDGVGAAGKLTKEQLLTDPSEALVFVKETNVDALAIAIGTSHGAYKFKTPPNKNILAIDRIKEINKVIPNTHLVMHGASEVPQKWLKTINDNGGRIATTYGVPVDQVINAIKNGVRKINIDTDLRMAATASIRLYMRNNPSDYDPRSYNRVAQEAMYEICRDRYERFGTAGNATKVKSVHLNY